MVGLIHRRSNGAGAAKDYSAGRGLPGKSREATPHTDLVRNPRACSCCRLLGVGGLPPQPPSSSALASAFRAERERRPLAAVWALDVHRLYVGAAFVPRSEEHTSELQP